MKTFLILLSVAITSLCRADDGWYVGAGGAQGFGRHENIRMVEETVNIKMYDLYAEVDAFFTFKNEGPKTTVTMGFPEERITFKDTGMEDVRSWVDGTKVKLRRKSLMADDENRDYKAVWLKDVDFNEGQVRKVRFSYWVSFSGTTDGSYSLDYTLTTGASWKGKIGKCTFNVDWSKLSRLSKPDPFLAISPQNKPEAITYREVGPRKSQIVINEFEPDYDLILNMSLGFWNFVVDGKKVAVPSCAGAPCSGTPTNLLIEEEKLKRLIPKGTDLHSLKLRHRAQKIEPKAISRGIKYTYYRLNDVIAALGGSFHYDRKRGQIRIDWKK